MFSRASLDSDVTMSCENLKPVLSPHISKGVPENVLSCTSMRSTSSCRLWCSQKARNAINILFYLFDLIRIPHQAQAWTYVDLVRLKRPAPCCQCSWLVL